MVVRLAEPDDVPAIVHVHLSSSAAAYAHLPPSVLAVSEDKRRTQWTGAVVDPAARVWVALDGVDVIGFCHLRLTEGPVAEIGSLYVEPGSWRRGAGRRLVAAARRAAAAAGYSAVALQVYEENSNARMAYEALGFTADPGTSVHERSGLTLLRYRMRLQPDA